MKGRKVNKVGRDTLTISLPRAWVEKNSIKKGMELEIDETNDFLVIHSGQQKRSEVSINVGNASTFLLNKWLNDSYMQNFDKLIINIEKPKIFNYELNKEVLVADYISQLITRYIGLEIISQNEKKIMIQNLIKENDVKNFTAIQRRTHSLYTELVNQICEDLSKNPIKFESSIKSQVPNVRKFIYYCTRLIISSNIDSVAKIKWYVLYDHLDNSLYNIEKLVNLIRESSGLGPSTKSIIREIFRVFNEYLKVEGEITTIKINELIVERYKLLEKISKLKPSSNEEMLLRELRIFTNIHNDFILAYFHLQPR